LQGEALLGDSIPVPLGVLELTQPGGQSEQRCFVVWEASLARLEWRASP
jgi:hypothetical protein